MIRVHTIISGGQTGADRGGLDAAILLGLKRGGMAPAGWRAEDGEIPLKYRAGMMQSASADYMVRTRSNVEASSATLILSFERQLTGGSAATYRHALHVGKPRFHFSLPMAGSAVETCRYLLISEGVRVLNVAGPRESREPGIQAATCAALIAILGAAPDDAGFGGDGP